MSFVVNKTFVAIIEQSDFDTNIYFMCEHIKKFAINFHSNWVYSGNELVVLVKQLDKRK